MEYSTLAEDYIKKLQNVSQLTNEAYQVIDHEKLNNKAMGVLRDKIKREFEPLEKQKKRLENNEFVFAVVGLESSGKSTFINAWLGDTILPSRRARCTYTTTKIYGSKKENEKLVIHTYSESDFKTEEQKLVNLTLSDHPERKSRAEKDLGNIQKYRSQLNELIKQGSQEFKYTDIKEIKEKLNDYIANVEFVYAIKSVELHTSQLALDEGVVFYDVPGLDSGLEIHENECQDMLSDCDAVILIQHSNNPNLVFHQQKIVEHMQSNHEHIDIKDKLFVFISHLDDVGTHSERNEIFETAAKDWHDRTKLPKSRIVFGSAQASLLSKDADPVFRKRFKSEEDYRAEKKVIFKRIFDANGVTFKDDKDLIAEQTGIELLKGKVFDFLKHDRIQLLEKKCQTGISNIKVYTTQVYENAFAIVGEDDPDVYEKQASVRWTKSLRANIRNYIDQIFADTSLIPKTDDKSRLLEHYESSISDIDSVFSRSYKDAQNGKEFYLGSDINPTPMNLLIRRKLKDNLEKNLDFLGKGLSEDLRTSLQSMYHAITSKLWHDNLITDTLEVHIHYSQPRYKDKVNELEVCLRNNAQRLVDIFISTARETPERKILPFIQDQRNFLHKISQVSTVEEGSSIEDNFEDVIDFLNWTGVSKLVDEILESANRDQRSLTKKEYDEFKRLAEEQTIEEIKSDLEYVKHFIQDGLFELSEIAEKKHQAIRSFIADINTTLSMTGDIHFEIEKAYHRNPLVRDHLNREYSELLERAPDLDIIRLIKQLKNSIEKL